MVVPQLSRFTENPVCETETIIGSKIQPFNNSAGTRSRHAKHIDINGDKIKNAETNLQIIVPLAKSKFILNMHGNKTIADTSMKRLEKLWLFCAHDNNNKKKQRN